MWKEKEVHGQKVGQFQPSKISWEEKKMSPFPPNVLFLLLFNCFFDPVV